MNDERATILLVEDDPATREFLADNLAADGNDVLMADGMREALRLLARDFPDLLVLDLGLTDGDGHQLIREVRGSDTATAQLDPRIPMLVLSGRCGEQDRIRTLALGADDHLGKPFSYPELKLRIDALLRRSEWRTRSGRLRAGDLMLDPSAREVTLDGAPLPLSQKEFAVLRILMSEPARVFTKEELVRAIWGYRSAAGSFRTLDSHACRLRRKLVAGGGGRYVQNVWGVGYRLVEPGVLA